MRVAGAIGLLPALAISVAVPARADESPLPSSFEVLRSGRVAALDASGALASGWHALGGGGIAANPCTAALALDSAEVHAVTGAAVGGTCIVGGSAASRFRLRIGATPVHHCYRAVEDFVVAPGYADGRANFISVWVDWTPPEPEPIVLIVCTYETFVTSCQAPPGPAAGFLASVAFESTTSLPPGTYLVQMDLCSAPGLWLRLPVDGAGAFEVLLGNQYFPELEPPQFLPPTSATLIRWGTEPGRPGTQTTSDSRAWIDHAPADGLLTANECVTLAPLPDTAASCGISNVAVGLALWADTSCAGIVRGDANCDGRITNFDIQLFVAGLLNNQADYLALGGTPLCFSRRSCWADLNRDGDVNNFDIDPFVSCLTILPPAGVSCP
ncbi:MAG: hypothetical protein HRU75_12240 [Planctomycetia bacterium]|nr:MAG: hypothetical protein HRU75_12240 [Planctomycetia bacterium]